uniref:Uncharacterized protein n=1 Tax=Timema genevievae TaxID=629358 RepID=A0A7R9K6E0_TIMGE|nr:unnamed protein product [Timema genevievae]
MNVSTLCQPLTNGRRRNQLRFTPCLGGSVNPTVLPKLSVLSDYYASPIQRMGLDLEEKEASLLPPRFLGNPLECVTTQEGSDVILTLDIEPSGGAPTAISW